MEAVKLSSSAAADLCSAPSSPIKSTVVDDFGKELVSANRQKYQLEISVRRMEIELRESQARAESFEQSLRNAEKLLWLEKERSATLENDRHQLNQELQERCTANDQLRRHLDTLRNGGQRTVYFSFIFSELLGFTSRFEDVCVIIFSGKLLWRRLAEKLWHHSRNFSSGFYGTGAGKTGT